MHTAEGIFDMLLEFSLLSTFILYENLLHTLLLHTKLRKQLFKIDIYVKKFLF